MLWYLCLGISFALIMSALYAFVRKKYGVMRYLYVLLCCFAAAFVIYLPPFFAKYDPVAAVLGSLINILRIISLDADYLSTYELLRTWLGTGVIAKVYESALAVLHVVLPAVSAMTAVTIIMKFLGQLHLRMLRGAKRDIHVFSSVNYHSVILAEDIRRCSPKSEILFLEHNSEVDHSGLQESLNCSVLDESIENIRARAKQRKVSYYCLDEEEENNLNAALSLLANLQTTDRKQQQNNHIFLFSKDPMVETMVDSLDKGMVDLNVVNRYQMAAYRLLEQNPLVDCVKDSEISVLLCGFGIVNREVLRAVSWLGQLADIRLKVNVVADVTPDVIADFRAEYPGLFTERYHIRFYSYSNRQQMEEALRTHCADAGYLVVDGETEAQTVDLAVFLRRFYYCLDPAFANAPKIFAYIENTEKAKAVSMLQTAEAKPERRVGYDIVPFGMASKIFTFANITDSSLEKLSKNVHLVYEDIFSDSEIDVTGALLRYNLFEVNKRSNRANALHIRYKLAMLGLDYTDDPDAKEVDLKDYLTPELLERLTYAEHDRWMAFLESEGWRESTIPQVKAYQASGISRGRHNCPLLKLHPYICPFEVLQDYAVELDLPDSTVYDRDLITRIPDILHDRWGVAGVRYKIVKKQ